MDQFKPKRILHIVSAMDRGGAETLLMNVYRNIDRSKIQFDFVVHRHEKGDYDKEIKEMGGEIYVIPSLGEIGPVRYLRNLVRIIKLHPYSAVHSHLDYQSGFPALAAKIAGIETRICHSHSTSWPRKNGIVNKTIFQMLKTLIKFYSTQYCSCSSEAARFLFGKSSKVKLLRNGIDLTQYMQIKKGDRKKLINELGIQTDAIIIGHVGRFSASKNQIFILKILKKLLQYDKRFLAIFIGDGPLKKQIEEEALKMNIIDRVYFLGVRDDIPILMEQFDVFVFPSQFEGFGIVTVEAQSAGTPCILSDSVPKSTDMGLGLVSYVSLEENIDIWCNKVMDALKVERPNKKTIIETISKQGFSIQSNLNDWLELYGVS